MQKMYREASLYVSVLFPSVCLTIHLRCYSNECTNSQSFLKHLLTPPVCSKSVGGSESIIY